jgi:hypothetical protein
MLAPDKMLRLMIELIFVLLGGLMVWLGLTGHFLFNFNASGAGWLILSAVVILWGGRALFGAKQWWQKWENWTRGLSLVLVGALMLAISRAPIEWVGPLLATAGGLLAVRGFVEAVLVISAA